MGTEAIVHSDRLALLDRGKVVGFFDSNNAQEVDSLIAKARVGHCPLWVGFSRASMPPSMA